MSALLKFDQIHSGYDAIEVLHGVSLEVNMGEIVSLIGANGAGKTTLLSTLFGNPLASSGTIEFNGENITALATYKMARRGLALVPEGRRIFAKMTIEENLLLGSLYTPNHRQKNLQHIFEQFPILAERRNKTAEILSGGEQQMLAIGRALMSEPKLLILDEPSLGLAPILVRQIFRSLKPLPVKGRPSF